MINDSLKELHRKHPTNSNYPTNSNHASVPWLACNLSAARHLSLPRANCLRQLVHGDWHRRGTKSRPCECHWENVTGLLPFAAPPLVTTNELKCHLPPASRAREASTGSFACTHCFVQRGQFHARALSFPALCFAQHQQLTRPSLT